MTPEKWQQFNMLQDVISTFSPDPKEYRSICNKNSCLYNPPKNKPLSPGCVIGQYMDIETASKLEGHGLIQCILNSKLKELLPEWMQEMSIDFLQRIQNLHDYNRFWNENLGLSEKGIDYVKEICNDYSLPFKQLKF